MTPSPGDADVASVITERRNAVNEAYKEELPVAEPQRLWKASRYLLDAGGKRLRPTVLLLSGEALTETSPGTASYRTFPEPGQRAIDLMAAAVSVEIIQTFTLIHDDIMDDDAFRRGTRSVHTEYDLETAILAGDTLYAKSFEIMLDTEAPAERRLRAIDLLAETCTGICEGQSRDVSFEGSADVTPQAYLEMIEQKTAILYAAAASLPAILLGEDETRIETLYNFGLDLGRAFQIKDDILDLTADTETLGKDQGSDLLEGKRTIVTIHAMDQGVDVDDLGQTATDLDAAVDRLRDAGSFEFAMDLARDYVDSAKHELETLPETEARQLLAALTDYVVEREY